MLNPDEIPKITVHKRIDRFFNANYHFSYAAVYQTLLSNPRIREGVESINLISMAPKLKSLLVNRAENSRNAEEIISLQFMETACASVGHDANSNLASCIRLALQKANFPSGAYITIIIIKIKKIMIAIARINPGD